MTEYGNGEGEFENAVHGMEKMRISNGDSRQIKQNGVPPAYTQGQRGGRYNRQPRNGHVQSNRGAYAGTSQNGSAAMRSSEYARPNASDAQLKTGYALHQDPAIISFSGAGGVPTGPMGAPMYSGQPQIPPAAAIGPFGPPPPLPSSGYTDPRVDAMLPSNYKRNFNNDSAAYGSYMHQSAPNAPPPMQDRRPAGRRPFERRPAQGYRTQETHDSDRIQNAATFDNEENDELLGDAQGAAVGQSTRPAYVINKKGVYVRGLDQQTTDADLRARFELFGIVTQCKVHVDLRTRACLGYGFVEFAEEHSARAAIDAFAGEPPGRMQVSTMRMPAPDMTNVYVRNLPLNMSDRDLENMFAAFGKVVSVRILRHPNNVSQGVGFARMSSQSECERIIETYNGCCLPGSPQPLVVKFADDSSGKRFKQRTDQDRFQPASAVASYDRPRPPRADDAQHSQVAPSQRSSTVPSRGHHYSHFNARNGNYQPQSAYQPGPPPNAYHPHGEPASSSAPQPASYPPHTYHAPTGTGYQPAYQPGGYYQPQPFAPPANFPTYAPAPYEQPPNGMYQQPPAPPGYHPPTVDGPPPFAPANYNNVPVSNIYMCASAPGQSQPIANGAPHAEPNMHSSRPNAYGAQPPTTASPYVDPAIISVRNTIQK